jgi:predicted transcriptional regulator
MDHLTRCATLNGMKAELKARVIELIERLPEDATLEDVQYAIYVHQAIEAGEADIEAGRVFTSDQVRQHFGLKARS